MGTTATIYTLNMVIKSNVLELPVIAPCGTGYSFGGTDEMVAVSG